MLWRRKKAKACMSNRIDFSNSDTRPSSYSDAVSLLELSPGAFSLHS